MLLFGSCEPFDAKTNPEMLATQRRGFESQVLRLRTVGRVIRGHACPPGVPLPDDGVGTGREASPPVTDPRDQTSARLQVDDDVAELVVAMAEDRIWTHTRTINPRPDTSPVDSFAHCRAIRTTAAPGSPEVMALGEFCFVRPVRLNPVAALDGREGGRARFGP